MSLRKFLCTFCALSLVGQVAWAAPAITSVSANGPLLPGVTLTITGTSFGTKIVPAAFKWDTFEGGTVGTDIANGWTKDAASNCAAPLHYPQYSSTVVRPNSTKSVVCRFDETSNPGCGGDGAHYSSSFGFVNQSSPGFPVIYMDGWVNYAPPSPESRNVKLVRIWTTSFSQPDLYANIYCLANTDGLRVAQDGASSAKVYDDCNNHACPFAEPWHGSSWWKNNWRHIQLALTQSSVGGSDGQIRLYTDGVLDPNANNWANRSGSTFWATVLFGNYVGHDAGGSDCPTASPGDTYIYWDDCAFDTTWARAEIGDNANYDLCSEREYQPVTAWSATSITITSANRGAFASLEGKYLFVVDRTGAVSPGFQLTSTQAGCVAPF